MELSYETMGKRRMSILSIDDNTNPTNAFCGNVTGMCCNQRVMGQREILRKTQEAYNADVNNTCDDVAKIATTTADDQFAAGSSSYRQSTTTASNMVPVNNRTPLIAKDEMMVTRK